MTWSLAVVNGDLSFAGPGGYATVSGQNKLIQDLKNWLLEPRGTDPIHPGYGCTLDGGMLPDGTFVDHRRVFSLEEREDGIGDSVAEVLDHQGSSKCHSFSLVEVRRLDRL